MGGGCGGGRQEDGGKYMFWSPCKIIGYATKHAAKQLSAMCLYQKNIRMIEYIQQAAKEQNN